MECPKNAGLAESCAGCPNQSNCASNTLDPGLEEIKKRMSQINKKILVISGKGGVGKSTVAATLSLALSKHHSVGVLDIDITGPSVPRILGVETGMVHESGSGWSPVQVSDDLCCMSIGFLIGDKDNAVIWRGPKKTAMVKNFLQKVDWGKLDYLIVDTPPGTSDEHISILQFMSESHIDGAIVVTTPQEVSLQDVRKEISFCQKVGLKILGVVENMSGFICPNCQHCSSVFVPTTGGAMEMCKKLQLNFLGSIPMDPKLSASCDDGLDFVFLNQDSKTAEAYMNLINLLK